MNRLGGHRRKAFRSSGGSTLPMTNLMAFLDLDADGNDDSGNGRHFLTQGVVTFGTYAGVAAMEGANEAGLYRTEIVDATLTYMTEFTFAYWYLCDQPYWDPNGWHVGIGATVSDISGQRFSSRGRSGASVDQFRCSMHDGTSSYLSPNGSDVRNTGWRHMICVVDGPNKMAYQYVDNVLDVTFDFTASAGLQSSGMGGVGILGDGDGSGSGTENTGVIARVGIWNKMLDSTERAAVYAGGTIKKFSEY